MGSRNVREGKKRVMTDKNLLSIVGNMFRKVKNPIDQANNKRGLETPDQPPAKRSALGARDPNTLAGNPKATKKESQSTLDSYVQQPATESVEDQAAAERRKPRASFTDLKLEKLSVTSPIKSVVVHPI